MKVLVTGANGQLGSEIRVLAVDFPNWEFVFTDFEELSITNEKAVLAFFDAHRPDICINCAAYTAVDKAEDANEQALVEAVNAEAVGFLAAACKQYASKLIHISTDYVFDGSAVTPYLETDPPHPASVYGATKLKGEQLALQTTDALIIRTAWVYSSFGKNFVKTMMRLMQEKPTVNVVDDQRGSPTYAADLAAVILKIIASEKWAPGIYHYTNEGAISWFDFALAIKEIKGYSTRVQPIPTTGYPTPAQRPAYSVLDKEKIKKTYGIVIPDWRDSLKICIAKICAKE